MKPNAEHDTLVLIPAYNEEKNISGVVRQILDRGYSVLVVDDGSPDSTADKARAAGAEVVSFEANKGKGAALCRGFEYAQQKGYRAVAVMDGDGQHDPGELTSLVHALDSLEADMVIGTRMRSVEKMPFIRKLTNKFMSRVVSLLAGCRVTDSQSGFRVMKTSLLSNITLKTKRFEIESEMIIRAGRKGYIIREIPVSTIYGTGEKSSIRPVMDTFRFFKLVLACLFC